MNKLRIIAGIVICAVICASAFLLKMPVVEAANSVIAVALDKANVEGGKATPATVEPATVTYQGENRQGVKLTLEHRARANNAILIPIDVDGKQFNTLQFKTRILNAGGKLPTFGIIVRDKNGDWDSTSFLKHTKELGNGWYQFSWDMINQPDVVKGADLTALVQIRLRYPFDAIAEGQDDVVTIADMNFVSGQSVRTGDPELYQQWETYIHSYKPNYSDSSKYLLPPETGRIAKSIALTQDGKALGQIVIPQNASDSLTLAGKELHHWLQAITGADVPIVSTADNSDVAKVLLGRQFATGKFDQDIAALGTTDGFAVRTQGKNIYIFGATDKGTLNGVFTFLENNTDIIWPRPQEELSVVFTSNPNLKVLWGDDLEIPATRLRGWGTDLGIRQEANLWMMRNKNNYAAPEGLVTKENAAVLHEQGNYIQFGGGHNISGYLGKNPAFYPVIDGKKVEVFNIWKNQPNFTAPGIADAVATNMLQYIKDKAPSYIDAITINIEDNWGVSTDPKSLEPIKLPDGSTIGPDDPAFRSTQYFIFLNQVVRKINAVYPNLMIETYAYFFTATAPKVAVDPHIHVMFAPYPRKDYRSPMSAPINAHWWDQMIVWSKVSPNFVMREYYGILNDLRPQAEVVDFDVKSYLSHGVKEYTAELMPDATMIWHGDTMRGATDEWNFMAMDYWAINRIYWNPNQDVEQLRKYYIRRTFHEAAPEMEKFFGIIRSQWYRETIPSSFEDPIPLMKRLVIQTGKEAELRQLLTDAAATVKNPTSRMMVDVIRKTFDTWATAATDPSKVPTNPPFKFTFADELRYGWGFNTDWEFSQPIWATATSINRDGKTVPAVRITVYPDRSQEKDFTIGNGFDSGLLGAKNGDVLAFNMNPATAQEISKPLQIVLTVKDKNGAEIQAPASAFTTTPDGGVKVQWKLEAETGKPFDAMQIKELHLVIPNAVCAGKTQSIFYITDMSIMHEG